MAAMSLRGCALVAATALLVVVGTNATPASASPFEVVPLGVPATWFGLSSGADVVAAAESITGAAAAGAGGIALAPAAVVSAAVAGIGAGLYFEWKHFSANHPPNWDLSPPTIAETQTLGTNTYCKSFIAQHIWKVGSSTGSVGCPTINNTTAGFVVTLTDRTATNEALTRKRTYSDGSVINDTQFGGVTGVTFFPQPALYTCPPVPCIVKIEHWSPRGTKLSERGYVPTGQSPPPPAPSGPVPNGTRQLTSTWNCVDGSGTSSPGAGWTSGAYTHQDAAMPAIKTPVCAPGTSLGTWTVTETCTANCGSTTPAPYPLITYTPPSEVAHPGYSECLGGDVCTLSVEKVYPDGSTQTCEQRPSPCTGWISDPARDDIYECHWGREGITGYTLPLADCAPLSDRYEPDAGPATQPGPTTLPAPGTTTPAPGGAGSVEDVQDGECWPSGWGWFNPKEWVLRPIKCALTWAFVPTAAQLQPLSDLKTSLMTHAPFSYLADAVTFVTTALSGTEGDGCWELTIDFPDTVGGEPVIGVPPELDVIDSCNGPVEAKIKALRPLLTVVAYVGICGPLVWWAWRQYAPGSQGVA